MSAALSTVVTAMVLAVPVMAGTQESSPVVLGHDGGPVSASAFAGLTSTATFSSTTGEASPAPSATAPSATGSSATGSSAAAPTTAPSAAAPAPTTPAPDPATSAPVAAPEPAAEPAAEPVAPAPEAPEPAPAPTPKAPAPVTAAAPAAGGVEDQVLALVNTERATAGCAPVSADGGLASVARAHSEDMRDRRFFDHVDLEGLDPFDRADRAGVSARAENIARGQQAAADVMTSWMNSAGHRANILDCSLTRLGVGVAQGDGGPWWTQLFG